MILLGKGLAIVLRFARQPAVIGEMLAGILLGPTLFGERLSAAIAPQEIVNLLRLLGEIGILLYLFATGISLNFKSALSHSTTVVSTAIGATFIPLALGIILGFHPLLNPSLGAHFAIFLGLSFSITAFPVLARIINDSSLRDSTLGLLALGSAALNDLLGWSLIAIFIIGYSGELANSQSVYLGLLLFVAFSWGIVLPNSSNIARKTRAFIEQKISFIFLPAFFAITGLRTDLAAVLNISGLLMLLVIVAVASFSKFFGAYIGARVRGVSPYDSCILGILLNTRGLMELIVLNLGYDLGILSTQIFSVLVAMAIITTLLTGPLLGLVQYLKTRSIALSSKADSPRIT